MSQVRIQSTATDNILKTTTTTTAWNRCMSLADRCASTTQLKPLHAAFIVAGLHRNTYAISKLITFCTLSPDRLPYASLLFRHLHSPNSFVYNTLIRAHSRGPTPELALHYFGLMLTKVKGGGVRPDCFAFNFAILACGFSRWVSLGRQLHGWVVKDGSLRWDLCVPTAVARMYFCFGEWCDARKVFDEIPEPDLVQWNVVLDGYVKLGLENEAMRVFRDMLVLGFEPDEFCVTTALKACAQAGALCQGKWIHEYVKKRGMVGGDVFVGTALVDMYAKCGRLDLAEVVFDEMPERNVFSWAAMIGGYAVHGHARDAIRCLERMRVVDGVRPDGVVLLGVLTACTHVGLVEEGWDMLDTMEERYKVVPKHEHYSCVVDLLCKAGRLEDALALIKRMPMKPLASVWGSLLSGCRIQKNIQLAEVAVDKLIELAKWDVAEQEAAFVQLSNVYLSAERSGDASQIRRMIGERGLKKTVVGCSMIEVDGMVNEFVSGDASHKNLDEIHAALSLMFPVKLSFNSHINLSKQGVCMLDKKTSNQMHLMAIKK